MKKKRVLNKKTIIPIILILLIVIGTSSYIFIKSKELKVTLKTNKIVNINDKVYNTDYIKNIKNGKITSKKELIKTDKTGNKKITLNIENYFKKAKKYTYTIKIIDKEKPQISYNKELTTEEGTEINLLENVTVTDNSKEEIKAIVEGEYDLNKPGTYKLYYVAQDSNKNETKKEFTLTVKEKPQIITVANETSNQDTSFTTSKGYKGITKNGITYIDGYLIANKTYSLPSNYNPGLNENVKKQANIMFEAAKNEGINLWIASGFRSYNTQKTLYNNYVQRDGVANADTYSARPGHSEHQSGLAFDVNEVSNSFDNTNEAKWLANNCYKYGFILRYPKGKTNETGYMYESWHFRYVGENLASKLYNGGDWITMESYFGITSQYN